MLSMTFYGHACFSLAHGGKKFLFDPFLNDNPLSPVKADDVDADYIFVSHAHSDHLGDTISIAKRTGATVISTAEIVRECQNQGANGYPMYIGGKKTFNFGYVRLTQALHGAGIAGGHACGIIVNINGFTTYFAGDTGLFGDMKLLGEIERINLFLVPMGGNYTMDIDDAVHAATLVSANTVIPLHYSTWPIIEADPEEFRTKIEQKTSCRCIILTPGETITLQP